MTQAHATFVTQHAPLTSVGCYKKRNDSRSFKLRLISIAKSFLRSQKNNTTTSSKKARQKPSLAFFIRKKTILLRQ